MMSMDYPHAGAPHPGHNHVHNQIMPPNHPAQQLPVVPRQQQNESCYEDEEDESLRSPMSDDGIDSLTTWETIRVTITLPIIIKTEPKTHKMDRVKIIITLPPMLLQMTG